MPDRVDKQPPERVKLCADGGCCPDVVFLPNGSIELSEFGHTVKLTSSSLECLLKELRRRGLVR